MAELDQELDRYLNSIPMITALIDASVDNLRNFFDDVLELQIADTNEELKFKLDLVNSTIEDLSTYIDILQDELRDPNRVNFLNYCVGLPTQSGSTTNEN